LTRRLARLALAAGAVRHLGVLGGMARSRAFLRDPARTRSIKDADGCSAAPRLHVVLPVLREAATLEAAVDHFSVLVEDPSWQIVVVTTERERAERDRHPDAPDTVALAADLAREGRCTHLHYPDPTGLKSDQLNHAAECLVTDGADPDSTFLVCYDADSRPAGTCLEDFGRAFADNPDVDVFHQSSRFELRGAGAPGALARLTRTIVDAGALRANRFVLAYELPRLLNRATTGGRPPLRSQLTYTHVTGHGLCLRLALLRWLPFPARSPLEDMHYSFLLNTHAVALCPVPSLDVAEVPDDVHAQYRQAAQWFLGPGRFARYRRDTHARPGWRTDGLAASAALISAEWLSCAVVPIALLGALTCRDRGTRRWAAAMTGAYAAQLVLTESVMHPDEPLGRRARRLAVYPVACTLFGAGGWIGAARLVTGRVRAEKTERSLPR
jgi:hypothetical protein